jgi:hypothetical protein
MCEFCDGSVGVGEYFADSRQRRRMLRVATEREVFRHSRDKWYGMECCVCRFRVIGFTTRLEAEFALLSHCYEDHRQE